MQLRFRPKLDYARGETSLELLSNFGVAKKGKETFSLSSSVDLRKNMDGLEADFVIEKGQKEWLISTHGNPIIQKVADYSPELQLERTRSFWRRWARHCTYRGRWRDRVLRSALTLKMLEYAPTGVPVAAATTSLPEVLGGGRNWDYRYTWLRDSAFSLHALNKLGQHSEIDTYLSWFLSVARKSGVALQIMHGVGGERYLIEQELEHLEGYKRSKPVRIGNAAYEQFQLDAYGIVVDVAYFSYRHVHQRLDLYDQIKNIVDFVARIWESPDRGIWEIRGSSKHYVHSKVFAWVALDRGIRLAEELGYFDDAERWKPISEKVKKAIMSRGWSRRKKAFTLYYGSSELDASNLLMPLVRFLPATHPKMKATIERVIEELSQDGLVKRYKIDDNLQGEEGAFSVCSFWLVDCLTELGRLEDARELFEKLLAYADDLGLYSEEIDPQTREALGNFPQAYTHMAFITSVVNLDAALSRERCAKVNRNPYSSVYIASLSSRYTPYH